MPQIKIERIVSFTSEDPTHQASNILSKDSSKKWKCKAPGEKSAAVVFQLDQPYLINAIDIGNENSAYVEVLVARSTTPEDFKLLLVMSSFMTPLEARQTQNPNKVRMFKQNDFSEPEKNEKWDRIKIVCTQPFNRHVQYGLSFVNLYSADGTSAGNTTHNLGKFVIRPQSPDNISAGSLFARRKQLQQQQQETPLKGAAAIREATLLAHTGSPMPKQKMKLNLPASPSLRHVADKKSEDKDETPQKGRNDRNRNELLYSKDEEGKHEKIDKLVEQKTKEIKKKEEQASNKKKEITPYKDNKPKALKRKHEDNASLKQTKKKTKKEVVKKPFGQLLENVILVISGIQNPDRANLRSMAISMGAKYRADWEHNCTHLICAFANTPKFNQVKGKGKIVKRQWIEDCYNQRKRLPWRRYALDKADRGPDSEEEICEKDDTPISPKQMNINSDTDDSETRAQGSDTDEKIAKIRQKQAQPATPIDFFNVDTDNESVQDNSDDEPQVVIETNRKLKSFFEDKIFYVDYNLDEPLAKKIKQYIVAYNGILVKDLEVSIDIIVTNSANCKVMKEIYPNAVCVAPDWIWECHNCQKLIPMTDYIYD